MWKGHNSKSSETGVMILVVTDDIVHEDYIFLVSVGQVLLKL
jgi:hypothetical protein